MFLFPDINGVPVNFPSESRKGQFLLRMTRFSVVNPESISPGWWFGTFFIFPYIGNNNPRVVRIPPTRVWFYGGISR